MAHDALTVIGDSQEVGISSQRPDGTFRPFITIWVVRVGEHLFVRSAYGPENGWFRRALGSAAGRIRADGAQMDVEFTREIDVDQAAIDDAFLAKYAAYPDIVRGMVGPSLYDLTIQLDPA